MPGVDVPLRYFGAGGCGVVGQMLDGGAEAMVTRDKQRVVTLAAGPLRADDPREVVSGKRPQLPAVWSSSPLAAHSPTAAW